MPVFHSPEELAEYFDQVKLDHARAVFRNEIGMKKWERYWKLNYRQYAAEQRARNEQENAKKLY